MAAPRRAQRVAVIASVAAADIAPGSSSPAPEPSEPSALSQSAAEGDAADADRSAALVAERKQALSTSVVQWYPGHIARAERQLKEQLKLVDVVLEVRDARALVATHHPQVRHRTNALQCHAAGLLGVCVAGRVPERARPCDMTACSTL